MDSIKGRQQQSRTAAEWSKVEQQQQSVAAAMQDSSKVGQQQSAQQQSRTAAKQISIQGRHQQSVDSSKAGLL